MRSLWKAFSWMVLSLIDKPESWARCLTVIGWVTTWGICILSIFQRLVSSPRYFISHLFIPREVNKTLMSVTGTCNIHVDFKTVPLQDWTALFLKYNESFSYKDAHILYYSTWVQHLTPTFYSSFFVTQTLENLSGWISFVAVGDSHWVLGFQPWSQPSPSH